MLRMVSGEFVIVFRLDAVFVKPRLAGLHGAFMRRDGNLRRLFHQCNFGAAFVQPHVMQQMIERNVFIRHMRARARFSLDLVDPTHQFLVELGVTAHEMKHLLTAFQHARQDVIDIVDGKGIVCAKMLDRALLTGAATMPGFLFGIIFAAKQNGFAMLAAGNQHQHSLWLTETGEVQKIAILAERVIDIAIAGLLLRRGQNGDATLANHFHQLVAATFEFGFGHYCYS